MVSDAQDPATAIPTGATLSYALVDEDGTAILSGTATKYDPYTMAVSIAITGTLDVSKRYRERWYGTIDTSAIDVYREARSSRHAVMMRSPLFNTLEVLAAHPSWTDYPAGLTSWDQMITAAWVRMSRRAQRDLPVGEQWTPDDLAEPLMSLFEAMWYEQAATYAGSDFFNGARYYRALYEAWWERARPAIDTDGDGTPDEIVTAGGASSAPGPRT